MRDIDWTQLNIAIPHNSAGEVSDLIKEFFAGFEIEYILEYDSPALTLVVGDDTLTIPSDEDKWIITLDNLNDETLEIEWLAPIVKRLALNFAGDLEVEGNRDDGSRFYYHVERGERIKE